MNKNEFKLANDPETPQDILDRLSLHEDEHIRASVALNINSLESTLFKLAKDSSAYVRDNLMLNKKLDRPKFKINQNKLLKEGKS